MRQSQKAAKQFLRRKTNKKKMDTESYLQLSTQYAFGSTNRKKTLWHFRFSDLADNCAYQIPDKFFLLELRLKHSQNNCSIEVW